MHCILSALVVSGSVHLGIISSFSSFSLINMNNRVKQVERLEASISKHIIRGQILLDEFVFDVCSLNSYSC